MTSCVIVQEELPQNQDACSRELRNETQLDETQLAEAISETLEFAAGLAGESRRAAWHFDGTSPYIQRLAQKLAAEDSFWRKSDRDWLLRTPWLVDVLRCGPVRVDYQGREPTQIEGRWIAQNLLRAAEAWLATPPDSEEDSQITALVAGCEVLGDWLLGVLRSYYGSTLPRRRPGQGRWKEAGRGK